MTGMKIMHINEKQNQTTPHKVLVNWLVILGAFIVTVDFLIFLTYWAWADESWMLQIVKEHFAVIVGLPMGAIAALIIVVVLEYNSGPIKIGSSDI